MTDTILTVVGNLTANPELRYTQSGKAVANFTIASTPRIWDRQRNEYRDGDALFLRCTCWQDFAENVAASLTKGARVIAQGKLKQRSYQDRDGNNRTSIELDVEDIGPSLRWATAVVTRSAPAGQRTATTNDVWNTPGDSGDAWGASEPWAGEQPF